MPRRQPPVPTPDDEFLWTGAREGRLLLRQCASCHRIEHPPSPMCRRCGSVEWTTVEMSGRGSVHSWIVSRHPTEPDDAPLLTAVIALEEGPRLVSNLVGIDAEQVRNDMAVEVVFVALDGFRLPQFRPVAGS